MALSPRKYIYGIHSFTPYNRATGLPYGGTIKVNGGSTLNVTGEIVTLTGGSAPYPWDAQDGASSAEITIKPKEVPNLIFQLFLGKMPTQTLNDTGSTSSLANKFGTSAQEATTGIASVSVESGEEGNLKFGKYVIKVVSATEIDVYGLSDVDFFRGTDKLFIDDSLKITASPLTIPGTGGTVSLTDFGVEFNGGSGAIAMTIGDTAFFNINPPSTEHMTVSVGESGVCVPEFGAYISAQKQGDGSMWNFDCFRVKALGFPFGMEEKAYNEAEITAQLMYDEVENKVFDASFIKPTSGCN